MKKYISDIIESKLGEQLKAPKQEESHNVADIVNMLFSPSL